MDGADHASDRALEEWERRTMGEPPPEEERPKIDRFLVVLRGDQMAVSEFRSYTKARRFRDKMAAQGFHPTIFGVGPRPTQEEHDDHDDDGE